MPHMKTAHIRVRPPLAAELERLAKINFRSVQAEGMMAIKDRIAANQHLLSQKKRK